MIKFIFLIMILPISLFAQEEKFDKFKGVWIDTVSKYQYTIEIDKGILTIFTKDQTKQEYVLKYNNNHVFFKFSKTEKVDLYLTNSGNFLLLNYSSRKDKYPVNVPYITTLKFEKKFHN